MVKNRLTEVEGRDLVNSWQQSGLGKREFCILHGIRYHRLQFWVNRVGSTALLPSAVDRFVKVELTHSDDGSFAMVQGNNGLRLQFKLEQVSTSFIKSLLTV